MMKPLVLVLPMSATDAHIARAEWMWPAVEVIRNRPIPMITKGPRSCR